MKNRMLKKALVFGMAATMCITALAGCGQKNDESVGGNETPANEEVVENNSLAGQTITVWSQRIGEEAAALEQAAKDFEEETGIIVEFSAPGSDYENLLRMKMASNEMPDVWSTHGWAVNRYSEVLADLSDEEWVDRTIPSILSQVTDENGRVLSMCINSSTNGIGYNPQVFEEYGLEVPTTIDELYAVCDEIIEKSNGTVIPIHIGGGDGYPIAKSMDYLSSTLTITSEDHNYSESLIDGSFDWENYRGIADFYKTLKEKGYVNQDILTATNNDTAKAMASGEAAMALVGWSIRPSVLTYNPEAEFGFFAIPAFYEGSQPVTIGGETDAWGIFKDTEHMEAAKAFLEYFARPDVNQQICETMQIRSAFSDVDADLGDMTEYFDNIKDLPVEPFFDRVYFPSGMWDAMQKYGQLLMTDDYTADDFLNDMSAEYNSLMQRN